MKRHVRRDNRLQEQNHLVTDHNTDVTESVSESREDNQHPQASAQHGSPTTDNSDDERTSSELIEREPPSGAALEVHQRNRIQRTRRKPAWSLDYD